jgi:GTP cyclohydrolase II
MFRLARCDCFDQLVMAMNGLADLDGYALIYGYDQDGRANGPLDHITAIKRMDEDGISVSKVYPERDRRIYQRVAFLIKELLGLSVIRLMTNNPDRLAALGNAGIQVERVAFEAAGRNESHKVMSWKKNEEGHLLSLL